MGLTPPPPHMISSHIYYSHKMVSRRTTTRRLDQVCHVRETNIIESRQIQEDMLSHTTVNQERTMPDTLHGHNVNVQWQRPTWTAPSHQQNRERRACPQQKGESCRRKRLFPEARTREFHNLQCHSAPPFVKQ